MMPDDPTRLHPLPERRRALIDAPPRPLSPLPITLPLADLLIGAATLAFLFAVAGYVIGLGEAEAVAAHAEEVATSADATLAEARRLCATP